MRRVERKRRRREPFVASVSPSRAVVGEGTEPPPAGPPRPTPLVTRGNTCPDREPRLLRNRSRCAVVARGGTDNVVKPRTPRCSTVRSPAAGTRAPARRGRRLRQTQRAGLHGGGLRGPVARPGGAARGRAGAAPRPGRRRQPQHRRRAAAVARHRSPGAHRTRRGGHGVDHPLDADGPLVIRRRYRLGVYLAVTGLGTAVLSPLIKQL